MSIDFPSINPPVAANDNTPDDGPSGVKTLLLAEFRRARDGDAVITTEIWAFLDDMSKDRAYAPHLMEALVSGPRDFIEGDSSAGYYLTIHTNAVLEPGWPSDYISAFFDSATGRWNSDIAEDGEAGFVGFVRHVWRIRGTVERGFADTHRRLLALIGAAWVRSCHAGHVTPPDNPPPLAPGLADVAAPLHASSNEGAARA